jgi:predicted DNA-binding protein with PD1-like motif
MKYSEAKQGRTFVIRLEDGEVVHEKIEQFARDHSIKTAAMIIVGGADKGSTLIVGPEKGRSLPVIPMEHILNDVHEVAGVGTLFPDEEGNPILHMHTANGRKTSTVTGCVRTGVRTWHILEIILFELIESTGVRTLDSKTGFKFLNP